MREANANFYSNGYYRTFNAGVPISSHLVFVSPEAPFQRVFCLQLVLVLVIFILIP